MLEATGPSGLPIALLCAMTSELRPLARALSLRSVTMPELRVVMGTVGGHLVVGTVIGIGPERAEGATERLLHAVSFSRVVLAGVSGGVADALPIGQVVAPAEVVDQRGGERLVPSRPGVLDPEGVLVTCASLQVGPGVLGALRDEGVTAVDMETAGVGAVCDARGLPWTVYRAISDRLCDDLVDDSILALTRPDGTTDLAAVVRMVARHPGEIRRLAAIGKDTGAALRALSAVVRRDLSSA